MPKIEQILARFTNYIPYHDRAVMKRMLHSLATLEQWIDFLSVKVKEGLSRYAMFDFLETQRANLSIEDDYYQNILVDALSFLRIDEI